MRTPIHSTLRSIVHGAKVRSLANKETCMPTWTRVSLSLMDSGAPRRETLIEVLVTAAEDDEGNRLIDHDDAIPIAINDFLAQLLAYKPSAPPPGPLTIYLSIRDDRLSLQLPAELTRLIGARGWAIELHLN